jgi:hypothetical protein
MLIFLRFPSILSFLPDLVFFVLAAARIFYLRQSAPVLKIRSSLLLLKALSALFCIGLSVTNAVIEVDARNRHKLQLWVASPIVQAISAVRGSSCIHTHHMLTGLLSEHPDSSRVLRTCSICSAQLTRNLLYVAEEHIQCRVAEDLCFNRHRSYRASCFGCLCLALGILLHHDDHRTCAEESIAHRQGFVKFKPI